MITTDYIFKVLKNAWDSETSWSELTTHTCFIVVASFAFYFFVMLASVFMDEYVVITDDAISKMSTLISWSNLFLNLLFMLIIAEFSQKCISGYYAYKRDNL